MNRFPLAALLLLAPLSAGAETPEFNLKLPVRAETPEFNLQEPISLDLKDAKLTDVITVLGDFAHVPVSIAPDVQGTISAQLDAIPYALALELIGKQNGLSLRIEGGKLVATTLKKPGAAGAAPAFDRPPSGPRLAVEEYARAFAGSDRRLFVGVKTPSGVRCVRLPAETGGVEIPVPGLASPALVSQMGREPVSETRFVAAEYPGVPPRAFVLREAALINREIRGEDESSGLAILSIPVNGAACADAIVSRFSGERRKIRLEVREGEDGTGAVLSTADVPAGAGRPFSTVTGIADDAGQHRGIRLDGYLSADGMSVAVVMVAVATWLDPSDSREYVYSQISSSITDIPFIALTENAQIAASLPSGAALQRPVQLTVRSVASSPK